MERRGIKKGLEDVDSGITIEIVVTLAENIRKPAKQGDGFGGFDQTANDLPQANAIPAGFE